MKYYITYNNHKDAYISNYIPINEWYGTYNKSEAIQFSLLEVRFILKYKKLYADVYKDMHFFFKAHPTWQ